MKLLMLPLLLTAFLPTPPFCSTAFAADPLYTRPSGVDTRWSSFENPTGAPGSAAKKNQGGKGHAWDAIEAGKSVTLMEAEGAGILERMWFTIDDRSTPTLRSLRLDMYWDGETKPAVSVPFGDFFGAMSTELPRYENELFSTGEGRSFNCFIPMPFRRSARVTLTNETSQTLKHLFYDINYVMEVDHPENMLYFHATWRRENPTVTGRDFEVLPEVSGEGRFLGCHISVLADQQNLGWWGEGEVKIYLDGDSNFPTLAGTGTEDYIGTAWGQGAFINRYQGCFVADEKAKIFNFYRYHVPDRVYFDRKARVTIQQMGGSQKRDVVKMLKEGRNIKPVTVEVRDKLVRLLDLPAEESLEQHPSPDDSWTNYFRSDDVSAVALFYLDKPANSLPALAPASERVKPSNFGAKD